MRLTLITPPSAEPVTLDEAKKQCRVDSDEDDLVISGMISAAVSYLDGPSGVYGRAIMPQVWQLDLPGWTDAITLPVEPVRSVSVTYTDPDGAAQTMPSSSYLLSTWPSFATEWRFVSGAARPALIDSEYPVSITINAGFADAAAVPPELKAAMLMMIGTLYENRESVVVGTIASVLPLGFDALIAGRRLV